MKKFRRPTPPYMVVVENRLPDYRKGQVYAWEAFLHEQYRLAQIDGRDITYEQRKTLVEAFVREDQVFAECIVICRHCEEEIADASLTGRRREIEADTVRRILSDFGLREASGRRALRFSRKNSSIKL